MHSLRRNGACTHWLAFSYTFAPFRPFQTMGTWIWLPFTSEELALYGSHTWCRLLADTFPAYKRLLLACLNGSPSPPTPFFNHILCFSCLYELFLNSPLYLPVCCLSLLPDFKLQKVRRHLGYPPIHFVERIKWVCWPFSECNANY
jgi:hypothetical protein